jgi:hypothetical protein
MKKLSRVIYVGRIADLPGINVGDEGLIGASRVNNVRSLERRITHCHVLLFSSCIPVRDEIFTAVCR